MALLAYGLYMEKGVVTAYSIKNYDTYTETKFINKALALHGKKLLLKRDRSRSHKGAV